MTFLTHPYIPLPIHYYGIPCNLLPSIRSLALPDLVRVGSAPCVLIFPATSPVWCGRPLDGGESHPSSLDLDLGLLLDHPLTLHSVLLDTRFCSTLQHHDALLGFPTLDIRCSLVYGDSPRRDCVATATLSQPKISSAHAQGLTSTNLITLPNHQSIDTGTKKRKPTIPLACGCHWGSGMA